MKLKNLTESQEALQKLLKCSLPISIAWDLKVLIKKIEPELVVFNEVRTNLIKELGEEDKNKEGKGTGNYRVKQENLTEYFKKINEVLEKELNIEISKINISSLKDINMTVEDLITLEWIITNE